MLKRTKAAHYLVSAVSLGLGIPAMCLALFADGKLMIFGMFVAEFLLLLNTGPLNAAVINAVGPHVRAMALAANIFIFHLLGDVPSAYLIGYISDKYSLRMAFIGPVVAIALSSAILFYGMRFAPPVSAQNAGRLWEPTRDVLSVLDCRLHSGLAWFSRILQAALGVPGIADISKPQWDRKPTSHPRVSIIVPARNEEEDIEQALSLLLALDYDNYEVIAVNDRSNDRTGEIIERIAASPAAHGCLKVVHVTELPKLGSARLMPCGLLATRRRVTGCFSRMRTCSSSRDASGARWPTPKPKRPITSSYFRA